MTTLKPVFISFLAITVTGTHAQSHRLVMPANDRIIVLEIDPGASLKVKELSKTESTVLTYAEYVIEKGLLKSRLLNASGKSSESYSVEYHHSWPEFIKIRNNDFNVESHDGDSLILDQQGRVVKVFISDGRDAPVKNLSRRFYYPTPDMAIEYKESDENAAPSLIIYTLDPDGYLLSVKYAYTETDINLENLDMNEIHWEKEIEFKYRRKEKNLEHVVFYSYSQKEKKKYLSQTFMYGRGKIIFGSAIGKAEVPELKTYSNKPVMAMVTIYEQTYRYSNW